MTYTISSTEHQLYSMQNIHTQPRKNVSHTPAGCVLLGVLKSVEQELSSRERLGMAQANATPLWFLAETERNIYLWRRGYSIADHESFSFWIDIHALITKRKRQLRRTKGSNPFIAFGSPSSETGTANESLYLKAFEELSSTIIHYAGAVSQASQEIIEQLNPAHPKQRIVVLPSGRDVDYNKR
jgi:hypothetical protein